MRQLFFPLRTSVELFSDPTSVEARARAKEAVVLYDQVVFEAGLFKVEMTDEGSFEHWRRPDALTPEELVDSRQPHEPGTGFSISIGIESEPGVLASPEAMTPFLSGQITASYAAEWHTDVIEELGELDPDWARSVILDNSDQAMVALQQPIDRTCRAITDSVRDIELDPIHKAFVTKALARDAVVAASMGAAFNVTSLFEPLLIGLGASRETTGRVALDILIPDVGSLPWEAIAEYREHPGSQDAREKLREFEKRALAAEPGDPLAFQAAIFRSISEDLFSAIRELQGGLVKEIAAEAAKTGVSFLPRDWSGPRSWCLTRRSGGKESSTAGDLVCRAYEAPRWAGWSAVTLSGTLVAVTFGAVLGALLAFVSSYILGHQQRGWQVARARFDRELSIVKALDEALVETELRMLNRWVEDGADEDRWGAAHRVWEQAWVRVSPLLINLDLKDRYEAVGRVLTELVLYDGDARPGQQRNVALRATLNARQGIAYFGREENLPPPCFPRPDELTRLLGEGDPDPLRSDAPLSRWLSDHPVPPWHPEMEP